MRSPGARGIVPTRLLGEEEEGHLGHHIHLLAACGIAYARVQEYQAVQLDLSALAPTSLSLVAPRLCLEIPICMVTYLPTRHIGAPVSSMAVTIDVCYSPAPFGAFRPILL